jgi:hypothetical protein
MQLNPPYYPKTIISFSAIGAWRRRGEDFLYRKERRL